MKNEDDLGIYVPSYIQSLMSSKDIRAGHLKTSERPSRTLSDVLCATLILLLILVTATKRGNNDK